MLDVVNPRDQIQEALPMAAEVRKLGSRPPQAQAEQGFVSQWVVSRGFERCPQGSVGFEAGREKEDPGHEKDAF